MTDIIPAEFPIRVGESQYGRGVFATRDIAAGEVVEVCPTVPIPRREIGWGRRVHAVNAYWFQWNPPDTPKSEIGRNGVLALGYGGLYNHGDPGNLEMEADWDTGCLTFTTTVAVPAGAELTHNYGWGDHDKRFQ